MKRAELGISVVATADDTLLHQLIDGIMTNGPIWVQNRTVFIIKELKILK